MPIKMFADGYTELWKKVDDATKRDMPKTQIQHLEAIAAKAAKEKNYGQMLKAEWRMMWAWSTISPDSVAPQMSRLELEAEEYGRTDPALAAICYAALGKTCGEMPALRHGGDSAAQAYFKKALANPAMLASKKADTYEPFVVKGRDAALFGNDLLSLIGYTAGDYAAMHSYYATTHNRNATLLTALDMVRRNATESGDIYVRKLKGSRYAASLDSLVNAYKDLQACGEVAITKYYFISDCIDVTQKEKYDFVNDAVNRWGEWPRMQELRNAAKELTNPEFTTETERNIILPGSGNRLKVKVRNIDKLTLTLTRLNIDGSTYLNPDNANNYKTLKAKAVGGTTQSQTKSFAQYADYETVEDSFAVSGLQAGVYLMELSAGNKETEPDRELLYVSDMFVVCQELPGNKARLAVLSGTTGQPVPGAKIDIIKRNDNRQTLTCDGKGETVYGFAKNNDARQVRAYCATDNAMPFTQINSVFYYYENNSTRDVAAVYTDRKIYRPGQTVHVAAILRHIDKLEQTAVGGMTFKLTLKDANYKTVAEKNVTTDAYGTASADFALPQGGLTGSYSVRTDNALGGVVSFRVEEYKRPTFEVTFDEVKEKYENGDTLTVTGRAKAYSGVPVQGARVKYTVRRKQALWWRFGYSGTLGLNQGNEVLAEGEAVTDGNGAFKIAVPMVLPVWEDGLGVNRDEFYRIARFYNITTSADVTDAAGETRNGELSLPLGSKPTAFGCDLPEKTLRDSLKTITFTLKNSAGNDIPGDVTYTVSGVDGTFTAKANTATEVTWNTAALLKSGRHTLTAVCAGDTVKSDFIVFSYDDVEPCVDTPDWFYVSGNEFPRDGSPVYLQFGSSDDNVHVLYTVVSGNKLLKSGTLELSDKVVTHKLAYKDEYGSGLCINLVWVKNGKAYRHNVGIERPLPDKRLILKWNTFRDRLTPGQEEEWTLNITRPDGKPAEAQLLATMYDASLDQIAPFSWWFAPYMSHSLPSTQWYIPYFQWIIIGSSAELKLPSVNGLDFGCIETTPWKDIYGGVSFAKEEMASGNIKIRGTRLNAPIIEKHAAMADVALKSDGIVSAESLSLSEPAVVNNASGSDAGGNSGQKTNVQLRENLEETAFFYPSLYTDTTGNVSIKFTLPESVTTWRFLGLAHDKQMNNGLIDAKSVASKKVMVQPNMPRFVRAGDRAQIAARIFNTSGNAVKGTAVMQLLDPETEKVIFEAKKDFKVEADSTGIVTFNHYANANHSLLICKIFAEGKDFSDGEQHYLPILPDAELVTTTVPFTQHGAGVKTIELRPLLPEEGRNGKLTIEYTNNPAWLMIQALPYIGDAREDNAIGLATAYYANSISAYLMKQSPRIKTVFDQWRMEAGQESLASSLAKNQELKNIVLDETPWVADADLESDQKQMLANYFNESTLANNLTTTLDKLSRLQSTTDGSWCWWPGMQYGSPTLTASIVETLVRLDMLTGKHPETKTMVDKAMEYLGGIVVKEVAEAKKAKAEGKPYYIAWDNAVRYLYICALSDKQSTNEEASAADFILDEIKANKANLNIYYKALMAVVLAKHGDTKQAQEYVKSLDEYTVATEEMGRYYDSPRAGYSWFDYRIPTQVAAIEAMTLVNAAGYADETEEMKRWLLQQKRVQGWDTPINSVNAVYAFLNGNLNVLENKEQTILAVDGEKLETPTATAGLGYVKTTTAPTKAKIFTATKTSDGTSWGAVYAQSLQKTSAITSSAAGITVEREILNADGKTATALKVGDRVKVRITIKADRDYDYVQVKDKRAACMEPLGQLSGYRRGYYCAPKDNATYYYFDRLSKGRHIVETEYYIDRAGRYETGTCTVECAYAPEYSARTASQTIEVK